MNLFEYAINFISRIVLFDRINYVLWIFYSMRIFNFPQNLFTVVIGCVVWIFLIMWLVNLFNLSDLFYVYESFCLSWLVVSDESLFASWLFNEPESFSSFSDLFKLFESFIGSDYLFILILFVHLIVYCLWII